MWYKNRVIKWIKDTHSAWKLGEISDIDYILIIDAIIGSKKYTQNSYNFAIKISKDNYRRTKGRQ